MYEKNGAEHVEREQDGERTGGQAENQGDPAEELQKSDSGSHDSSQGYAHLPHALGDSCQPHCEELLSSVSNEDYSDDHSEDGQRCRKAGREGRACGVRHVWCSVEVRSRLTGGVITVLRVITPNPGIWF